MKTLTIRRLDRYAGIPLCFALSINEKIRRLFVFKKRPGNPGKILFVKLVEQGATVLAYPAVRRAVELVGRENVYFCVFKENRPILDIMEMVLPQNIFEIRHDGLATFAADMMSFLYRARKLDIDCAIDMEFFSRASALICYLTGAKIRVGCHRYTADLPYRGDLMTHRIPYNPYIHTAHAYSLLVEAALRDPAECPMLKMPYWGLDISLPLYKPSSARRAKIRRILADICNGVPTGHIVLLNPNASDMLPIRKWGEEKFIELARRLLGSDKKLAILLTGAPSERKACEGMAAAINSARAVSLAGHTTLEELFALYCIADVLVTNDSGPGHFAALTNIKTVVMFGPETPELFGPLGTNATVIWNELACSPCVNAFNHRNTPCKDNVCMQAISVDEVFESVKRILKPRR
jgi:ADP-heptose:LPS heptosyltransferase